MDIIDYDFKTLFDEYCSKYSVKIKNILQSECNDKINEYRNAFEKISDISDVCEKIDRKVVQSGNENVRRFILDFYKYLIEFHDIDVFSNLESKKLIAGPLMRELEIAKLLHTNPTRSEIEDELLIAQRTLTDDLRNLKDGIDFLDTKIQLDIKDIAARKLECSTTVHPIFLPLNLTEVYALTKYLPSLIDDDDLGYDIILSIISRIKKQLSNYAVEKLDLELDNNVNASFYQENEEFLNKKNNLILYALKSGETFEFLINDVMVKGVLKCNNDGKYIILGNGITTKIDDFKEIKFLKKA